jgi:hypothetical protein
MLTILYPDLERNAKEREFQYDEPTLQRRRTATAPIHGMPLGLAAAFRYSIKRFCLVLVGSIT